VRCFIAINLPSEIRKQVSVIQEEFKNLNLDAKFVEFENLHVTLKFLGDIDKETVVLTQEVMSKLSSLIKSFKLSLFSPGAFPDLRKPRVLWLGIKPMDVPIKIIEYLDEKLEILGLTKEKRKPHPHITLARICSPKNIHKLEEKGEFLNLERVNWQVEKVSLFKSDLTGSGPIYENIFSTNLAT